MVCCLFIGNTRTHNGLLTTAIDFIAERQLAEVEVQQGFPILLLKLINDNNVEMVLRFAGSLYFKNYIKRHWVPVSRYGKTRDAARTVAYTHRSLGQ